MGHQTRCQHIYSGALDAILDHISTPIHGLTIKEEHQIEDAQRKLVWRCLGTGRGEKHSSSSITKDVVFVKLARK